MSDIAHDSSNADYKPFPAKELQAGQTFGLLVATASLTSLAIWQTQTSSAEQQHLILQEILKRQMVKLIESTEAIKDSSHRLEGLTKWLVGLTVVLGVLTLALVVDEGNKFRREYFSEPPRLTAPQTPPLPEH